MSFGYGCIGAAPPNRPAWLRPYVLVEGKISSAPLDLPQRFEAVLQRLQAAGWRVAVKSIGTDFGAIPTPRDQPLELYLLRVDRAFTAEEAQAALGGALHQLNLAYSPIRAWAAEVTREVITPTARQGGRLAKTGLVGYLLVVGSLLLFGRRRLAQPVRRVLPVQLKADDSRLQLPATRPPHHEPRRKQARGPYPNRDGSPAQLDSVWTASR